jgi:hypothetical protein
MNERLLDYLKTKAAETAACDDPYFLAEQYTDNSSAYDEGVNDGEILLARNLLDMFGEIRNDFFVQK